MITLYLARHGETEENLHGILQGITPGHLTEKGREQASALGRALRDKHFDVIISSPLLRARVTAEIIVSEKENAGSDSCGDVLANGNDQKDRIRICPLLRERDWGSLTLKSYAEGKAMKRLPDDVETLDHGMRRAALFVRKLLGRYDGKTVLAVGHGFIDRCIISQIEGVDKSEVKRMENGEVRRIEIGRNAYGSLRGHMASGDEVSEN